MLASAGVPQEPHTRTHSWHAVVVSTSSRSFRAASTKLMGDFARRLGQLAARSLESESANILKTSRSNRHGLSRMLDSTLRRSHNMRIFGLGTLASLASRERYGRFTASMHAVYHAMEASFDKTDAPAVARLWDRFGTPLRREKSLREDLAEVGIDPCPSGHTPATAAYVAAVYNAADADSKSGGARLVGHFYTRYFADLFGGQALAYPTRLALRLSDSSPRHYDFGSFGCERRANIEAIYAAINDATQDLSSDELNEVVRETERAFALNVAVYAEEGRLYIDAAHGAKNVVSGFVRKRLNL